MSKKKLQKAQGKQPQPTSTLTQSPAGPATSTTKLTTLTNIIRKMIPSTLKKSTALITKTTARMIKQ